MQDNVIHGVMDTGAPAVDRAAQSPPGDTSWLITRGHLQLDHLLTSSFDFSLFLPSLILSLPHFFPSLLSPASLRLSLPSIRLFLPSLSLSLHPSFIPSFPPSFFTSISLSPSFLRLSHHSLPRSFLHFLSPSFLPHLLSVLRPSLFTLSFSNGPSLFSHFIIASHSSAMDWYYLSICSTFCQWKGFPSIALRVIFSLTLILLSILILLSFISIFRPPLPFFPRVLLITSSHSLFCLLCCSLSLPLYRGAATVPLRIIKTYLPASKPKTLSEIFAFFF